MSLPPGWSFLNPYNFVPFAPGGPERHEPPGHDRFRGHSGRLVCRLELRSPIFIRQPISKDEPPTRPRPGAQRPVLDYISLDGQPIVPSTSLKGVIRSVVEAIGNGCALLAGAGQVPPAFEPCRERELCVGCRLFGMVARRGRRVYQGAVALGDARLARDEQGQLLPYELDRQATHLAILSGPKPRHTAFYRPAGQPAGRKFYYHRLAGYLEGPPSGNQNSSVRLLRRATFDFPLSYENLADDELAFLLYALELEPAMGHKLGMGKPIGLGSVKLAIRHWTDQPAGHRYRAERFATLPSDVRSGAALQADLDRHLAGLRASTEPAVEALRHIWRLADRPELRYPDQAWFAMNPATRLPPPRLT